MDIYVTYCQTTTGSNILYADTDKAVAVDNYRFILKYFLKDHLDDLPTDMGITVILRQYSGLAEEKVQEILTLANMPWFKTDHHDILRDLKESYISTVHYAQFLWSVMRDVLNNYYDTINDHTPKAKKDPEGLFDPLTIDEALIDFKASPDNEDLLRRYLEKRYT